MELINSGVQREPRVLKGVECGVKCEERLRSFF